MPRRAGFSNGLVSTHETFRGNVDRRRQPAPPR